jgi:hypothetical protein
MEGIGEIWAGLAATKEGYLKSECALADTNMKVFAIRKDLNVVELEVSRCGGDDGK